MMPLEKSSAAFKGAIIMSEVQLAWRWLSCTSSLRYFQGWITPYITYSNGQIFHVTLIPHAITFNCVTVSHYCINLPPQWFVVRHGRCVFSKLIWDFRRHMSDTALDCRDCKDYTFLDTNSPDFLMWANWNASLEY